MTNKEIRAAAKEKRKTARGLVPVALLFFCVTVVLEVPYMLASYRGAGEHALLAYYVVILLFMGLVGGAGIARASISAWNTGVARPGELFSCLTDGRRFLRALAPVLVIIALGLGWIFILEKAYGPYMENMMNFTQSSTDETGKVVIEFSPFVYAIPLAWLCLAFGSMIVTQLYYAIFLWPEVPIGEVLWRGGKRAAGAIGRLICMNVAICWKPFLIFLGVMIVGVLLGMFMGMVAFLIILILLMIGMLYYVFVYLTPYMMLAFGGLEIDVFSEKPEEAE